MSLNFANHDLIVCYWVTSEAWELEKTFFIGSIFEIETMIVDTEKRIDRESKEFSLIRNHVFRNEDEIFDGFPDHKIIAFEQGCKHSESFDTFQHPLKALYCFGGEARGLSCATLKKAHQIIELRGKSPFYATAASSIVLYDRLYGRKVSS